MQNTGRNGNLFCAETETYSVPKHNLFVPKRKIFCAPLKAFNCAFKSYFLAPFKKMAPPWKTGWIRPCIYLTYAIASKNSIRVLLLFCIAVVRILINLSFTDIYGRHSMLKDFWFSFIRYHYLSRFRLADFCYKSAKIRHFYWSI